MTTQSMTARVFRCVRSPAARNVIRSLLMGGLVFYFATGYICQAFRVEGGSMQPLIQDGDRIIADRLSPRITGIHRGDVVVFSYPSDPEETFIKRVIGLPGEVISIRSGRISINGAELPDEYVPDDFRSRESLAPTLIPRGHYFVAGDHRNRSNDSRLWAMSPRESAFVPERYIHGRVILRYWPPQTTGLIPG